MHPNINVILIRCVLVIGLLGSSALSMAANEVEKVEVRRDVREVAYGKVLYYYYQNRPFDALSSVLANPELSFNASGTVNVMLGDLYSRFGLTREADVALTRSISSDVTASNRNEPWLNYAKLLYRTRQDSLALNFLSKPPTMLTPMQESERIIMTANILLRVERQNEAIELLQNATSTSPYFAKLLRYNYALALLQKTDAQQQMDDAKAKKNGKKNLSSAIVLDKASQSLTILEQLANNLTLPPPAAERKKSFWGTTSSTASAVKTVESIEDEKISAIDVQNLNDKIALSTAYLYLQQKQPLKAQAVLRNVQLDSAYSNSALLTSAHVNYQLKDYRKAYNFASELGKRNGADPLVQEGWLLAARSLEEFDKQQAVSYYQNIIVLLKQQYIELNQLKQALPTMDIVRLFPIVDSDPILISLPDIKLSEHAGIWAFLLDNASVKMNVQQLRQMYLLQQKLISYGKRTTLLEQTPLSPQDAQDLKRLRSMLNRISNTLSQAYSQDSQTLIERTMPQLAQRQEKVDFYLTEAYLGQQRIENQAKDGK